MAQQSEDNAFVTMKVWTFETIVLYHNLIFAEYFLELDKSDNFYLRKKKPDKFKW